MVGSDVKLSSTQSESLDTMATLPMSITRYAQQQPERPSSSAAKDKEAEAKSSKPHFMYHQIKRTSMFVVLSLLYGKLIVVACIAVIVSQELTKSLPIQYYEGFFTVLFGVSIVFLMYLFCFLLQDSSCSPCCSGGDKKEVKKKKKNVKKAPNKKEQKKDQPSAEASRTRPNILQIGGNKKGGKATCASEEKLTEPSPDSIDIEAPSPEDEFCKRKTHILSPYGSFFLRVGAIGFGLATMIYIGLQFGLIFEIPFTSPCFELLRSLNPILQMVFTFMQLYFIFMNSRLKIHRLKFIARFGLMHVMATNICVWIKTLVFETLNAMNRKSVLYFNFSRNIVNTLANEYNVIDGKNVFHVAKTTPKTTGRSYNQVMEMAADATNTLYEQVSSSVRQIPYALLEATTSTSTSTMRATTARTMPTTATTTTSMPSTIVSSTILRKFTTVPEIIASMATPTPTQPSFTSTAVNVLKNTVKSVVANATAIAYQEPNPPIRAFNAVAQALVRSKDDLMGDNRNNSCGRMNIMGTIVQDSAPFLYPFVIEYCLIGAAVIFVMWRHIGRTPRYVSEENIEHKLEAILSQRAVAIAQAHNGSRLDCVGASKGLFFGLLLLVGSLICMLLFFVLIHHRQFSWLAIYLADASHSTVMALSILAIIIGFCRAKNLRFYPQDATTLNDILLRVSAFGLFIYATFSVIAGARYALVKEQNLLVLVSGTITIFQVVLQLLFIGDMSKRHVYLSEHDRNKPGRQIVTFLLICNITMWILFTFESQKVLSNPVQLEFFGEKAWKLVEHVTLPLCIFHRFHSAVVFAEIWKNSYKPRID